MTFYELEASGRYKNQISYPKDFKHGSIERHNGMLLYNEGQCQADALFKADMEIEFEVQNNPKKDLLFKKAWERGHAYGYSEVYGVYSDLVELIK